jgi:hypothetical protein
MKWEASTTFDTPDFTAETSLQASVTGVQVHEHNGDLVVTAAGGQTLFSLPLGPLNSNLVQSVAAEVGQLKEGLTKTYYVAGVGNVTATWTVSGLSVSTTSHGITTAVAIKLPDEIEISTTGTVHTPAPFTLKPVPVDLDVTTTLTFRPPTPTPRGRQPGREPGSKRVRVPVSTSDHAHPPILVNPGPSGAAGAGEGAAEGAGEAGGEGLLEALPELIPLLFL